MKIESIEAVPVKIPLTEPFKAAYGERDTADFVLVRVRARSGHVGLGEASTIPIYDRGNMASVVYCIEEYFSDVLVGEDPRGIHRLHREMNRAVKGERYAKAALDNALIDLVARRYEVPAAVYLGGTVEPVPVSWVFGAGDPERIREQAKKRRDQGYGTFKLKVGLDHGDDLERVDAVRGALGEDVPLRLDGNEAWDVKEAIRKIRDFQPFSPAHVEQPVPAWNRRGLREVREAVDVPIAIDESAATPREAVDVLERVGGDLLNVKTARLGGIEPARRVVSAADLKGVKPLMGSLLELGLGTVVNGHFAAATPELHGATELVGPHFLDVDVVQPPVSYEQGKLVLPDGPGWGVRLRSEVVEEFGVTP